MERMSTPVVHLVVILLLCSAFVFISLASFSLIDENPTGEKVVLAYPESNDPADHYPEQQNPAKTRFVSYLFFAILAGGAYYALVESKKI